MVHNVMNNQSKDEAPEEGETTRTDVDQTKSAAPGEKGSFFTKTAVLSTRQLQRHIGKPENTSDLSPRNDQEIILVVRGIIERFVIPAGKKVVLGRADVKMRYVPDIDLTPYGALDRGVSREHAHLWVEKGELYISDNDSTNGTYVSGEQLETQTPTKINKGDELMLGRLAVQILFR